MELTPEERYFYLYLLTCTKTTQCGIFPLPKRLAEMETGYNRETVDKLMQRFIEYGKVLYDSETKEIYMPNWLRYNPITNTNVEKCVLRELKGVKSKTFLHMFLEKCIEEELSIPLLLAHFGSTNEIVPEAPELEDDAEINNVETNVETNETPAGNVFTFYEQHFSSISPYAAQELSAWIDDLSEELVLKALQIAFENNKRSLAYVKGILRDWQAKGYQKVLDTEEDQEKFRTKKQVSALYVENTTEQLLEKQEQWKKHALSDEELRQFLKEQGIEQ